VKHSPEIAVYELKSSKMVVVDESTYSIEPGQYPVFRIDEGYYLQVTCRLSPKMYQFDPKSVDISLIGKVVNEPLEQNCIYKIGVTISKAHYNKEIAKGSIKLIVSSERFN